MRKDRSVRGRFVLHRNGNLCGRVNQPVRHSWTQSAVPEVHPSNERPADPRSMKFVLNGSWKQRCVPVWWPLKKPLGARSRPEAEKRRRKEHITFTTPRFGNTAESLKGGRLRLRVGACRRRRAEWVEPGDTKQGLGRTDHPCKKTTDVRARNTHRLRGFDRSVWD